MNADQEMNMDSNRYNANALGHIKTLNYAMLQSPYNTELPKDAPVKELKFTLTGNMNHMCGAWIIKSYLKPIKSL